MGHLSWPPHAGFLTAKHFCELYRPEPNLGPYVKLARQRLQPSVTVALQIDPAFAQVPPGPEGIVAQDKVHAIDTHLGIWLYAFPAITANYRGIVIVAGEKVFAAMQRLDTVETISGAVPLEYIERSQRVEFQPQNISSDGSTPSGGPSNFFAFDLKGDSGDLKSTRLRSLSLSIGRFFKSLVDSL
jgi:hypothetical protein